MMRKTILPAGYLVAFLFQTAIAQHFYQPFDSIAGNAIGDANFSGSYWELETSLENKYMVTNTPGGWDNLAIAESPAFDSAISSEPGFSIQYSIRFPDSWEYDQYGSQWKEQNKTWLYLLDSGGNPIFSLLFKPNRPNDVHYEDLILHNHVTGTQYTGQTWRVTPFGTADNSGTVRLRIHIIGSNSGDSAVSIYYSEEDYSKSTPIITAPLHDSIEIEKLRFEYKTGTGNRNYHARIDDILVASLGNIFHNREEMDQWGSVLYTNPGQDTSTSLTSGQIDQAVFQMTYASLNGEASLGDWEVINSQISSLKGKLIESNGLSMIVLKTAFQELNGQAQTFFTTSLLEDTLSAGNYFLHQSKAFEIVDDNPISYSLKLNGTDVDLSEFPAPISLSEQGANVFLWEIEFESGFVGRSKSVIFVK